MRPLPKFVRVHKKDGHWLAVMKEDFFDPSYDRSAGQLEDAIWGWEKLLDVPYTQQDAKENHRVNEGLRQAKMALAAIKSAQSNDGAASTNMTTSDGQYSTQQLTSKSIKGQMVASWVMGLFGLLIAFMSLSNGSREGLILGGFVVIGAIAWFYVLKVKRWWDHG